MMAADGTGAHPDAKQRVELSKESVCPPASEPPKPKVCTPAAVDQSQRLFAVTVSML